MPLETIGGGAYRIVEVLGQGGFGTVYRAHHASLGRDVAIKVLRGDLISSAGDVERFRREARTAARLTGHPNIVAIYDYGEQDGLAYLILEHIDGPTLQAHAQEPLPHGEVVHIIREVARALDFAHSQGVVHRDVKPSNVMLDKDGRVVLTDFGIVKLLEGASSLSLTGPASGTVLGTPYYMAPEQIENRDVGPASDLYALGVVAYELIAGRVPFSGSALSIMHQHMHARPPAMSSSGRAVPPAAERVVEKALAKQPTDRFETAVALAEALDEALLQQAVRPVPIGATRRSSVIAVGQPGPAATTPPGVGSPASPPRGKSGRWLVPTLVIINLIALTIVALSLGGALGGRA